MYCIGNLLQQMCVRKVGAPVFATLICVRLLASVVGEPDHAAAVQHPLLVNTVHMQVASKQ